MIEALACPECHAESYRALGAHGLGVRVSCELCGCVYLLPSARRLRERADRYWQLDEPSYHKPRTAGAVEPVARRSFWARVWTAWLELLAEWRGE
jgi:hypothetical protein